MAIYVYGGPQNENLVKFVYDSLVSEGISRFFWSYKENFDLNILAAKREEELTFEEREVKAKAEFLLSIKPGDYIIHVNVPKDGEVTVGKVIEGYFFQKDLPAGQTDGRHCLRVKVIASFRRDDPRVYPEMSKRLKLRGSHWEISQEYEKDFFASLYRLMS